MLTADAAQQFHRTREGLVGLCHAVLEGAVAGARLAVPARPAGVLREVIAGLADGFCISAKALELTLEEARSQGARFAREDLDKAAKDLRDVGDRFTAAVSHATMRLRGQLGTQLAMLGSHAQNTIAHAKPALETAIAAASEQPVQLGMQAARAGAGAAREVAGVLFSELGRRLEEAGKHLRQAPE